MDMLLEFCSVYGTPLDLDVILFELAVHLAR
jgi:hypothetical protein